MSTISVIIRCFLAIVFLFSVTACTEKVEVDAAHLESAADAAQAAATEAAASQAATDAAEAALKPSEKKEHSNTLEKNSSVYQSSESYNSYSSSSVQDVDPIGNLSSSETYSLCSEGCSAMGASGSTYSECVSSCTQE